MAKQSAAETQKMWFWVLVITVAIMCVLVIVLFSQYNGDDMNKRYSHPFESRSQGSSQSSNQYHRSEPSSPGLRESDIQKLHGNRYDTY